MRHSCLVGVGLGDRSSNGEKVRKMRGRVEAVSGFETSGLNV